MSEDRYEEITIRREIERLVAAAPFHPFVVVMASGDRYKIEHASEMVFSRDAISVMPMRGGLNVLRFNQISSLEISES